MLPPLEVARILPGGDEPAYALTEAQARLRQMVLDTVRSPHTRRNYGKGLDDLFRFSAGRPLSRALLMEWKTGMDGLAPSTVNVRLAAMRKLVEECVWQLTLAHLRKLTLAHLWKLAFVLSAS